MKIRLTIGTPYSETFFSIQYFKIMPVDDIPHQLLSRNNVNSVQSVSNNHRNKLTKTALVLAIRQLLVKMLHYCDNTTTITRGDNYTHFTEYIGQYIDTSLITTSCAARLRKQSVKTRSSAGYSTSNVTQHTLPPNQLQYCDHFYIVNTLCIYSIPKQC